MNTFLQILRLDDHLIATVSESSSIRRTVGTCLGTTCAGTLLYGLVFGIWRSPLQAGYAAIKMPVLFLSTVAVSGTANAMLSQVLGAGLSFRQVLLCILIGMSISAALLGALSPVALFFVLQSPSTMAAYPGLLIGHTALVGVCGAMGIVQLYRLLCILTAIPRRIILVWFLISGFAGCQLSWILSPFLAMPGLPEPFFNPAAFSGNFYEYLWHTLFGGI